MTGEAAHFSKNKKKGPWHIVKIALVAFAAITGISVLPALFDDSESEEQEDNVETTVQTESVVLPKPAEVTSLQFGDLLSAIDNGEGTIVIKAKIHANLTDNLTVAQNYHNVERFIKDADMDGVEEIQYWAIADMNDGSEQKVIAFTVGRQLIDNVLAGRVAAISFPDYVTDLWIHPSLTD